MTEIGGDNSSGSSLDGQATSKGSLHKLRGLFARESAPKVEPAQAAIAALRIVREHFAETAVDPYTDPLYNTNSSDIFSKPLSPDEKEKMREKDLRVIDGNIARISKRNAEIAGSQRIIVLDYVLKPADERAKTDRDDMPVDMVDSEQVLATRREHPSEQLTLAVLGELGLGSLAYNDFAKLKNHAHRFRRGELARGEGKGNLKRVVDGGVFGWIAQYESKVPKRVVALHLNDSSYGQVDLVNPAHA